MFEDRVLLLQKFERVFFSFFRKADAVFSMLLKHYDITQFGARPPSKIPGESTKHSNSDEDLNSKSCVKRNSDSKKRNK
jgi:hypothetical protein